MNKDTFRVLYTNGSVANVVIATGVSWLGAFDVMMSHGAATADESGHYEVQPE